MTIWLGRKGTERSGLFCYSEQGKKSRDSDCNTKGKREMQIIEKSIGELKPYENNPRKNEDAVEYVANSIREFGWRVPLVIDRGGTIVAGHTRYLAAEMLGIEKIPCVVADDLSEEQKKCFRIIDNKISELSEWDYNLLFEELDEIEGIDMGLMGFSKFIDEGGEDEEDRVEIINGGGEIALGSFDDEKFKYECPCCGFRFNG